MKLCPECYKEMASILEERTYLLMRVAELETEDHIESGGAYVEAWVWISAEEAGFLDEEDSDD